MTMDTITTMASEEQSEELQVELEMGDNASIPDAPRTQERRVRFKTSDGLLRRPGEFYEEDETVMSSNDESHTIVSDDEQSDKQDEVRGRMLNRAMEGNGINKFDHDDCSTVNSGSMKDEDAPLGLDVLIRWLQEQISCSSTNTVRLLTYTHESISKQLTAIQTKWSEDTAAAMEWVNNELQRLGQLARGLTDIQVNGQDADDESYNVAAPALLRSKDGNILLARIEFQYGACPEQVCWSFIEVPPRLDDEENEDEDEDEAFQSTAPDSIVLLQHEMWSMWNPYYARTTDYVILQPQATYVFDIVDAFGHGLPGGYVKVTLHRNVETAATTLLYKEFTGGDFEIDKTGRNNVCISFTTSEF